MATTATIPDTLPADFSDFDAPAAVPRSKRAANVPDTLPADFDEFDDTSSGSKTAKIPLRTPTLDELTTGQSPETQTPSPTARAASVGRSMIPLSPPKSFAVDTTQILRNPFTNALELQPPIATEEEKSASGTLAPAPQTIGTRVKRALGAGAPAGSEMANLTGQRGTSNPDEMRLLAPEQLMTETEQQQHPILTGAGEFAGGMTTPENLALLGLTAGAGQFVGPGAAVAKRMLAAGFSIPMLISAARQAPEVADAFRRGDSYNAKRLLTQMALTAGTAGLAGSGMLEESAPPFVAKGTISGPLAADEAAARAQQPPAAPQPPQPPGVEGGAPQPPKVETVGAGEATVPEKQETLNAQVEALAKGTNPVVYFPKGTKSIPPPPDDVNVTVIPGSKPGAGTYYHDDSVTPEDIKKAVKNGTYGELLGHEQTKQEATVSGATPLSVVARVGDGTEAKASVVDASRPDVVAAQAATLAKQFPEATISVEKPEDVVAARQEPNAKAPENGAARPLSAQTQVPGKPLETAKNILDTQLKPWQERHREDLEKFQEIIDDPNTTPEVKAGAEAGMRELLQGKREIDVGPPQGTEERRVANEKPKPGQAATLGEAALPQEAGFPNASGESGGSLEAIKRQRGEKAAGTQRIRIDTRSGQETPLIGPEAVDAMPGLYDRIVLRKANGTETVLGEGAKAKASTPASAARPAREGEEAVGVHDLGEIGTAHEDLQDLADQIAALEARVKAGEEVPLNEITKLHATADRVESVPPSENGEPEAGAKRTSKGERAVSGTRQAAESTEHEPAEVAAANASAPAKPAENPAIPETAESKGLESPPQSAPPAVGDHIQINAGKLKGQTGEVTRITDEGGAYVRTEANSRIQYVKAGDFEAHPAGHGPGTPLAGHLDTTGTRIEQLAQTISENAKDTKPVTARIDIGTTLANKLSGAKDAVTRGIAIVKGVAGAMFDALRRPAKWTEFDDALGKYQGAIQKSAFELRRFAKSLKAAVPDPVRREGIANFIEAAGDKATLKRWADQSKGSAKRGYEAALDLTDAEKTIARNMTLAQDERFQLDKDAGLLEHEVENYVMHAWGRTSKYTKKVVNAVRTMMLETKPSFTKQRVFGTYFDGEQAGYKPISKDAGFLFSAREHAANQAIAARAFIRQLLDGKAEDGRPLAAVSGSGRPIADDENVPEAYLIDPKTKPEEVGDYRSVDHPALRKWTWATNSENGEPIFVRGDIVIHPDVRGKLKNVLSNSALRALTIPGTDVQPVRIALNLSSEFKNTLLSLSGFHQTQESLHALFHKVNPFRTEQLDFSDPIQQKLVDHGLQVASFNAQEDFGEGLSSGLTQRIPVIGKYFQKYNDYLFSDAIPRLKMTLAQEALERNLKRYSGKLSEDQIYAQTANQANAAFGELNYTMMARNKTFQDVLRMALLAPDFLEARGRFVGQALKPYGKEQAFALMRGALGLYVGARILNTILDKDPHWDPQDAFNVVYKGHTFTLRSIPADIEHLFTDPRGFIYNRLNPVYGRGGIEAITGRDQYGRKRDVVQQAKDLVGGGIPIPFQGMRKSSESGPLDTALSSAGVSTFPYQTPAEKLARSFTMDSLPLGEESADRKKANQLARQYEDQLRKKQITPAQLAQAREAGKISASDQQKILARAARTPLQNSFRNLTPDQALQVWNKANDDERKQIRPLLANKLSRINELPVEQRDKLKGKILGALHPETPPKPSIIPRWLSGPRASAR